jgi:hypothetical protein
MAINKAAVRELLSQVEGLTDEVELANEQHRAALAEISAKKSALIAEMATALDGATKFSHPSTGREVTVVKRSDEGVETFFLRGLGEKKAPKKGNIISLDA